MGWAFASLPAPSREEFGMIRFARYQPRRAPLSSVFSYRMWCQAHSGGNGSCALAPIRLGAAAHYESTRAFISYQGARKALPGSALLVQGGAWRGALNPGICFQGEVVERHEF